MQHSSHRKKLVSLDIDRGVLAQIAKLAANWFDVLGTVDVRQAQHWLEQHDDVAVFVTDHATQRASGCDLLKLAQSQFPEVRRIVMTSFAELSVIVEGLHTGAIQKLIQKPIDRQEFLAAIAPVHMLASADSTARERLARAG